MQQAFPEAMVERESYQNLIDAMTNDPGDRHVLAAAVAGRADVLVTFNTRDFPHESCVLYGVDVQDPDTFLVHQFGLIPDRIMEVLRSLSEERKPPMDTPERILRALSKVTPRFCALALEHLSRRATADD